MHDLIKKNEGTTTMADDKVLDQKDWRRELAKGLRDRVDSYSKQMLALRERELKKNLGADPALAAPAPMMKVMDPCPLCGMEDVPGKCKCLQGPAAAPTPVVVKNEDCATPPPPEPGMNKTAPLEVGQGVGSVGKNDGGSLMCSECKMSKAMCKCMSKGEKSVPDKHKAKIAAQDKKMPKQIRDVVSPAPTDEQLRDRLRAEGPKSGWTEKTELGKKEFSSDVKAKEPVKQHKSGGNGIQIKALNKAALPAPKVQAQQHSMIDASKAALPKAAAPKLPSPEQHANRASMFSDFMPKAAAPAPAAKPMAAPKPAMAGAAPKLPGMGAPAGAPKPAAPALPKPLGPPAGVAHLKPPAAAGAPAAGAKPPALPKPAAPAPMGKSENTIADLKKTLGSCALCNKTEHLGQCS